jgi:hypothetical protein
MATSTASSSAAQQHRSQPSTWVRLTPLQLNEVPAHPDLPLKAKKSASLKPMDDEDVQQPDLLPFMVTLLNDGMDFLSPVKLPARFKHHSLKNAPPSASDVEVLTYSVSASSLNEVPWKSPGPERRNSSASTNGAGMSNTVRRTKPETIGPEHWFTRRSIHKNISSKDTQQPGHAQWQEFVFGLRDNHSKHEEEFTPTLFDARKVVDWAGQVRKLEEEGSLNREGYRDATMSIYEMCHEVPKPLSPRMFAVLVITASVVGQRWMESGDEEQFVAVTVPVYLPPGTKAAFYSSFRNYKEGENEKQKSHVVQGLYCAVETCTLRKKGDSEEVDWIMGTASDAKGNLPMFIQKLALPGAVPKDVSYFMKWIKTVDETRIEGGDD